MKASPQLARLAAMQGLPLLEAAIRDRPDDLTAREFLGHTLEILDRPEDALHAFEEVLSSEPGRELVLRSSGRLLVRLQRLDLARSAWQKTIVVNPWRSIYRLELANNCYQAGDWPGAIAACREASGSTPNCTRRGPSWSSATSGPTSPTRPTPSFRHCYASTPPAARAGSTGTSKRNRPVPLESAPSRTEGHESTCEQERQHFT